MYIPTETPSTRDSRQSATRARRGEMTPPVETVETVTKRRVESYCLGGGERRRQRADIRDGRSGDDDDDDDDDDDASLGAVASLEAHANGLRAMRACVEEALRGGVDALLTSMTGTSGTTATSTLWMRVHELERRARRAETRVQTLEDALVEKTTETEALRERLGREMLARGAAEDGCESPGRERMRAELALYKEACQKYRKRAERFEELYRRGVGAGGKDTAANAVGGKPECGRATTGMVGGVEELVLGKTTTKTKAAVPPKIVRETQLFGDDVEKLAPGGVGVGGLGFKRAMREVREATLEDDLWGATQKKRSTIGPQDGSRRDAARMVDEEVENARSGGGAKEEDARRRAAAPPLDRIFLDSKNKGSAVNETTNGNKVRKNKRLSDNSPTGPNEVFGDSETAAARGQVKCVEVVRKKSEREQLNAYACEECRTFYSAMMPEKDRATIKCPHALPPNAQNSRHRAKWAPEPAPKGFWNLAFTPPEKSD